MFELFVPPAIKKARLDPAQLTAILGHSNVRYAPLGRLALVRILRALGVARKVLLPTYLCDSVQQQLTISGWDLCYYDCDPRDLNADVSSIEAQIHGERPEAVVIASMYGNPADLTKVEELCRHEQVWLIDDAAQSAGASLHDRPIGSFGDAGMFSFSPGKSTPGALGAFYWCSKDGASTVETTKRWLHALAWLDYFVHRQGAYSWKRLDPLALIPRIRRFAFAHVDFSEDSFCDFEEPWLGGVINALVTHRFAYRAHYFNRLASAIQRAPGIALVQAVRGVPHPHKAVLIVDSASRAERLRRFLERRQVRTLPGYKLLARDPSVLPNACALAGRIIELPIENNECKMNRLSALIGRFSECKSDDTGY